MLALTGAALAVACALADDPDWVHDVAPIIHGHCLPCHTDDGPAPFPLVEHGDVASRATFLMEVVASRHMPPWLVDERSPAMRDVVHLDGEQRETLRRWLLAGKPRGEGEVLPAATRADPAASDTPGDRLVLAMERPQTIPADGPEETRRVVFPLRNTEPLFVSGLTWHTQAPTALHAVTLQGVGHDSDDEGRADQARVGDAAVHFEALGSGGLGAVSTGLPRFELPAGFAFRLPADAELVAEMHVQPVGRRLALYETVELLLCADPDPRRVQPQLLSVEQLDVPAGDPGYRLEASWTLPCDVDLLGVLPRAGSLCTTVQLRVSPSIEEAVGGEGGPAVTRDRLLDIAAWNPRFRRPYLFQRPQRLAAGTLITARWLLDNSADNLANPSIPPARVTETQSVTDERVALMLWVAPVDAEDASLLR
jgi:hypothetical protein